METGTGHGIPATQVTEQSTRKKMDAASYEEKAAQIAASFSYETYKIARSELFAHIRMPAMTIRADSITFNTACINGLEDAVYIQIMVSNEEKRIAIRRRDQNDKDAIRWCIAKPDKRKSRKISGRDFSKKIYKLMGWDMENRYKLTGYYIEFKGEPIYVFELENPDIYHEKPKRTKEEREELKQSMSEEEYKEFVKKENADARTPFYPDDVENTFGVPVKEHEDKIVFANPDSYQSAGQIGGRKRSDEDDSAGSTLAEGGNSSQSTMGTASDNSGSVTAGERGADNSFSPFSGTNPSTPAQYISGEENAISTGAPGEGGSYGREW